MSISVRRLLILARYLSTSYSAATLPPVRPSCGVAPVPPPPPPLPPSLGALDRERLRTLPREALRRRSLALPLRPLSRRGGVGRRGSPPRPPPPPLPPSLGALDRERLRTLPREALRPWRISCLLRR
ncbi:hypothetical protein MNEG_14994, partial [Monoraphidium neglectum]